VAGADRRCRNAAPRLRIGVRFASTWCRTVASAAANPSRSPASCGFGIDAADPARIDLAEPIALVRELVADGVTWINVTAASPYYAPHAQRPALFPPSDGYPPPEDPLAGVARLLDAARAIKAAVPAAVVVSSGWTYLQEWLPHVAQACRRAGFFDAVGLGAWCSVSSCRRCSPAERSARKLVCAPSATARRPRATDSCRAATARPFYASGGARGAGRRSGGRA
jgi:hypothetical protein